jgi:hypothetical protein
MAKRNADRMFEKFFPLSSGWAGDGASVLDHTGGAMPTDAIDGTGSGKTGAARGATLNLSSIKDVVIEL